MVAALLYRRKSVFFGRRFIGDPKPLVDQISGKRVREENTIENHINTTAIYEMPHSTFNTHQYHINKDRCIKLFFMQGLKKKKDSLLILFFIKNLFSYITK